METKTKQTVTLENGYTKSRTSKHHYTHVLVTSGIAAKENASQPISEYEKAENERTGDFVLSWHRSLEAAEKAAKTAANGNRNSGRYWMDVRIVEVDQEVA